MDTTRSNPLSLSAELNLTSLSSDSGVQTGKVSEMSFGENEKQPKSVAIPADFDSDDDIHIVQNVNDDNNGGGGGGAIDKRTSSTPTLSRQNSVRARANMFAAMEAERMAQPPKLERKPSIKSCNIFFLKKFSIFCLIFYV